VPESLTSSWVDGPQCGLYEASYWPEQSPGPAAAPRSFSNAMGRRSASGAFFSRTTLVSNRRAGPRSASRALFDLSRPSITRASDLAQDLLDHQGHIGVSALKVEHPDAFEADEGREDLALFGCDIGALVLLPHNTKRQAPS
jgi:hypothetical protein